jgi:Putative zinc-finger
VLGFIVHNGLKSWLSRRLTACREIAPLISQSIDRKLSLKERLRLKLHLLICIWCARYLVQLKLIRQLMRRSALEPEGAQLHSERLSREARERILAQLKCRETDPR